MNFFLDISSNYLFNIILIEYDKITFSSPSN